MSATAKSATNSPKKEPRRISWQEFQNRYIGREGRYKYEWVNGYVEKTENTMNPNQLYIQFNLQDFFAKLLSSGKLSGQLLAEPELIFFLDHHRRPDMAWLTRKQANNLINENAIEVPAFVIEVISNKDAANALVKKMEDYRKAGVQVVWQIYPQVKQVHVYSGKGLRHSVVCTGDEPCSAAPALPAFEMKVSDIFRLGE
jgi:Uma2 family endonuclease